MWYNVHVHVDVLWHRLELYVTVPTLVIGYVDGEMFIYLFIAK